ncbi:MAG: hypothetical protein WC346_07790 [Methanogenium sp.]|jgi:hypothetical protein
MDTEFSIFAYFLFGFLGGLIGKAFSYFWKIEHENGGIKSNVYYAIGILLSGLMGGLLAIVIDKRIELSITVGIFTDLFYTVFLKKIKKFAEKII